MKPYTSGPETPIRFAPLIAGKAPLKFDDGTVPLNEFAVTIPAITIPSTLVVIVPTPAVCVILFTLISYAI